MVGPLGRPRGVNRHLGGGGTDCPVPGGLLAVIKHFVKKAKGTVKVGRSLEGCSEELECLWGQERGVKGHPEPDLCPFEDATQGLNGHPGLFGQCR